MLNVSRRGYFIITPVFGASSLIGTLHQFAIGRMIATIKDTSRGLYGRCDRINEILLNERSLSDISV